MQIVKPLLSGLLILLMTTQTACSESFMGKTAQETFSDPRVVKLINAAEDNKADEVKSLLREGVNIDSRGEHGITPALWMMAVKNYSALKLLFENGANPNAAMDDGELSLVHIAAGVRSKEVLTLVLDYGGNPSLVIDENSDTPLMVAIAEFRFDNADLLIERGANINQHTKNGNNAARRAISIGDYDYALKLLELGYNHNLVDLAKDAQIIIVSSDREPSKQKVIAFLKQKLGSDYPQLPAN